MNYNILLAFVNKKLFSRKSFYNFLFEKVSYTISSKKFLQFSLRNYFPELSEYDLHAGLVGDKSHLFIEKPGARIAGPYIQGNVVKTVFSGESKYVMIQIFSHMLSSAGLVHTDVVDIQRLDVL